jgi:hypothetical protein
MRAIIDMGNAKKADYLIPRAADTVEIAHEASYSFSRLAFKPNSSDNYAKLRL